MQLGVFLELQSKYVQFHATNTDKLLTRPTYQMAQGMGLSRLGAEADPRAREPPKWRTPWESVIKREVGRRLWWNVGRVT
jgi:hypothetical protein